MSDETVKSKIWQEVAEQDNPFAASVCLCGGYDVYGEILQKATWIDYCYLLFQGERPSPDQSQLLEGLAIALANPGPRESSVMAAMSAGAGGSTNASSLMAALAVGAGNLGGGRELVVGMENWKACGHDLMLWRACLKAPPGSEQVGVWLALEHPAGFDPHGASCAKPVRQLLDYLSTIVAEGALGWLKQNREQLEMMADSPLAMSGVAAAALVDLNFSVDKAEMLYLLLRLPGAAVHALEQKQYGWRKFPFFKDAIVLTDDSPSAPSN